MNDLENRLAEALSARAESVQPEDLSDRALAVSVVPLWRRTSVMVAIAASVAVVVTSVALLATREPDRPQPADPRPTLELPPDVGADWGRAKASPPAELDLDGDGTPEKVRFLAADDKDYDGDVRLQTTLSSDGSSAHGLVDLGTTIGIFALDPIDADRDGDEELVLFHEPVLDGPDFAAAPLARPVVLDLRDGLLVQAPPTDADLLLRGSVVVPGAGADHYDMVRLQDFWLEDGRLLSSRSLLAYPAVGMDLVIPELFRVDVLEWQLAPDGVLSPVAADPPCLVVSPDGRRRACADGEPDALPSLAPVADERIEIGEEFSAQIPFSFVVRLEADVDPSVVVEVGGQTVRQGLELGGQPQIHTTTPSAVFRDGISLLARGEGTDGQVAMQVLAQDGGTSLRPLSVLGDVPFGIGRTDDALTYRTWLTDEGALFTAVAQDAAEVTWDLHSWQLTGAHEMGSVPVGVVCFGDVDDPATAERC